MLGYLVFGCTRLLGYVLSVFKSSQTYILSRNVEKNVSYIVIKY